MSNKLSDDMATEAPGHRPMLLTFHMNEFDHPDVMMLLALHRGQIREISPPRNPAQGNRGPRSENVTFWSARRNGELAGTVGLREITVAHAEIIGLRTVSEMQGMGIGRALVDHAMAQARERGFSQLSVEVATIGPFAHAPRLFERVGFQSCEAFPAVGRRRKRASSLVNFSQDDRYLPQSPVIPTPSMSITFHKDELTAPEVVSLLVEHRSDIHKFSPPKDYHALVRDALRNPTVTGSAARCGGDLVGVGALKELAPDHGEIALLRTAAHSQGAGIGRRILHFIIDEARSRGYTRLSVETGNKGPFNAALRLFESEGFVRCGPFRHHHYTPDNCLLTLEL